MPDVLMIVLGAGASADSTSDQVATRDEWKPPVVRELFNARYAGILNQYPFAQYAAADIRRLDPNAISIETFLREKYAPRSSELAARKFFSVPLYLQHLFLAVSEYYTPQPDNYDLLVSNALEDLDMEVLFVTLNYDLLLDRRLHVLSPLNTLNDYVNRERGWSLIKLHGSVDWGHLVQGGIEEGDTLFEPPAELSYARDIVLADRPLSTVGESYLDEFRSQETGFGYSTMYFPALSVPLGEEDELSCPQDHVDFLTNRIQQSDGLHLLVVGYSGIDREVLNLLDQTDTTIKTVGVVNKDENTALEVHARMAAQVKRGFGRQFIWHEPFSGFVQGEGWDWYRRHLEG